jgi:hypothetical protein
MVNLISCAYTMGIQAKLQEYSPPPPQENIQNFKAWNFLTFLFFNRVIFGASRLSDVDGGKNDGLLSKTAEPYHLWCKTAGFF